MIDTELFKFFNDQGKILKIILFFLHAGIERGVQMSDELMVEVKQSAIPIGSPIFQLGISNTS